MHAIKATLAVILCFGVGGVLGWLISPWMVHIFLALLLLAIATTALWFVAMLTCMLWEDFYREYKEKATLNAR